MHKYFRFVLDQNVYELAGESKSAKSIQSVEEIPEGSTQSTAKNDEIDLNAPANTNAAEPYSWNLSIGHGNNYKLAESRSTNGFWH